LFQASTILPSLIRVMTMPVNSTGAWVALNPRLSPFVFAPDTATGGYPIAFANLIFDDHCDIGKGLAELRMKGPEACRAA
jgi:hypothetical protein